ncbi:hypothetical protein, partial [Methylobacterium frigidaeris]
MLVLGAGASFTSENSQGKKIKIGDNLAKTFADRAGIDYAGENLVEVLGAVRGTILSDPIIHSILSAEYKGCAPSPELEDLFKFTWKRIYTWNIDDTLENAKGRSVQSKRYY